MAGWPGPAVCRSNWSWSCSPGDEAECEEGTSRVTPACHHCHLPPPIPPGLQTFCLITQTDPAGCCSAAVTSRVGWVNYLKGFLCSFCCPNATPGRVLCMLAPCPCGFPWVGIGVAAALPPGMELSHRGGSGWAEPN